MSLQVSVHILAASSLERRVATYTKWLKLAQCCLELWNFNAVFEIMAGLGEQPMRRASGLG